MYNVMYYIKNNIKSFFKNIIYSIKNLFWYFKVIWKDRWYDYNFLYILLDRKLEQMEKSWKKDTHYINSEEEYYSLTQLRKCLKMLIKDTWISDEEYHTLFKTDAKRSLKLVELEKKRMLKTKRKFFYLLYINIDKFWD